MVKTPSWLHGLDWSGSVSGTTRPGRQQLREEREEEEDGDVEDGTSQLGVEEHNEVDQKLAAACNRRGVELAFDGHPWGRCSCHPEG